MKTRTALAAIVTGIILVAIAPLLAHADTYRVRNSTESYRGINIYSKAGCLGHHDYVERGTWSSTAHDWKTWWQPGNTIAWLHNYTTGGTYSRANYDDWPKCRAMWYEFSKQGVRIILVKVRYA
jgi:hypothetical protein